MWQDRGSRRLFARFAFAAHVHCVNCRGTGMYRTMYMNVYMCMRERGGACVYCSHSCQNSVVVFNSTVTTITEITIFSLSLFFRK